MNASGDQLRDVDPTILPGTSCWSAAATVAHHEDRDDGDRHEHDGAGGRVAGDLADGGVLHDRLGALGELLGRGVLLGGLGAGDDGVLGGRGVEHSGVLGGAEGSGGLLEAAVVVGHVDVSRVGSVLSAVEDVRTGHVDLPASYFEVNGGISVFA